MNTNARSFRPKIPSFITYFNELDISIAVITETWFSTEDRFSIECENLLLGSGISSIMLNREQGPHGVSHGGVAILGKDSRLKMKQIDFPNPEKFEVLPVKVSVREVKKGVTIIGVYIPPGYSVSRGRACLQHVNDLVLHLRQTSATDDFVCVCGDFNQWEINASLEDFPDLEEAITPPTRNNRRIDRVFANWDIVGAACLPPLEAVSDDGNVTHSDHKVQLVRALLNKKEPVVWKKITFRPYTETAAAAFKKDIASETWSTVMDAIGSNSKANAFQATLDTLMDKHFPQKTIRRKNDDLPWFNEVAKKKAKRKRAVFRAEAKSDRWVALQLDLEEYLEKRRQIYLSKQRVNMTGPSAQKEFYKNVKNYQTVERPRSFDVREMRPGRSDIEVADEVAAYFNEISHEFKPLDPWQIPRTYDRALPAFTPEMVYQRLTSAKKPNSMVQGDIFPRLVTPCAPYLAIPLSDIYNTMLNTFVWPIDWKKEWVTVIPKKTMPTEFSELRNISCTKLFSKIFESFLLQYALEEIGTKPNQFGGTKGCSTSHLLIELWQNICENAEDYRSATVLAGIDYSKAFNRMSFQHCLDAFKKKGASTPIIRLIATFLTNRQMAVKVGDSWSTLLPVNGGCPQGSILGVFLFNITTDNLEDRFMGKEEERISGLPRAAPPEEDEDEEMVLLDDSVEAVGGPSASTPSASGAQPPAVNLSPIGEGLFRHSDMIVHFNRYTKNLPQPPMPHFTPQPREEPVGTQNLVEKKVLIVKYVDDNLVVEKVNFGNCPIITVNGRQTKKRRAPGVQNGFNCIVTSALDKGMVVNAGKTGLLCISDSLNYLPEVFIDCSDGVRIYSGTSMKVLGFEFSNRPTVSAHVQMVCKKLRRKYWVLYHLGRLGFDKKELVKVYRSSILPIADYCCVVYHSMLTDEQDEQLENAQIGALRAIFGYKMSARKLREAANIKTLRKRRIELCDNFARKCIQSEKFCHWFPLKTGRRSARGKELYREEYARCDRLKNSPLFYLRRRMNGKEGKVYGERYRIYREN